MSKLSIKFFSYKGHIGANSDLENGKFLNDPKAGGQLGVVSLVENIGLPDEVKLLILKKYKREGGSFANMMLTTATSGNQNIGILGHGCHIVTTENKDVMISRDCDLEVLDNCIIIENNPPEDFKKWIDEKFKNEA